MAVVVLSGAATFIGILLWCRQPEGTKTEEQLHHESLSWKHIVGFESKRLDD
jgi:hypothetical protein